MKVLYIAILIFISTPLFAQVERTDVFALSLEELMLVEITGSTLTAKDIRTVPSSVSVFTRQDIKALGIDYLDELMNYVTGFQSYRQGEDSAHVGYSSRGRKVGSAGREVLILVDGLRTDNQWTNGTSFTLPLLSLTNIEQVEFIRGPGSAIYGSNAFLGVINIITVQDVNELQFSGGENGRFQAHILTSKKWEDVEVSLFAQHFEDSGDLFNVQDTFSANRITTQDPVEGSEFNVNVRWKKTSLQFKYLDRRGDDFYVLGNLNNNTNRDEKKYLNIGIEQIIDWSTNFNSRIKLGYRKSGYHPNFKPSATININADLENDEIRFELQNDWQRSEQASYQFGFEYRRPELTDIGGYINNSASQTPFSEPLQQDIFGFYGQMQHKLFENTELTLGARFDHYSGIDSNLSPRLALVHSLDPDHTLKFFYGEAFRAPSANELGSINNPVVAGNSSLLPEIVKTWEVLWLSQWTYNTFSLGFFDNTFENSIEQQVVGSTRTFVNSSSEQSSQGIETELIAPINQQWTLRASYTLLTDKPSASFREANSMASLLLSYQRGKWNFNLSTYYHDEREFLQKGTGAHLFLDDYFVTNTKLRYQFNDVTSFFLQAKNMLDEDYFTPAQVALTEGIPNRGREVSLGLSWQL